MKVTFILKGLSEAFFKGFGESLKGLDSMSDAEKFAYLSKKSRDRMGVTMKVNTGQFRDVVELNQIMRQPYTLSFKLEPRKGYQLATFEVERA